MAGVIKPRPEWWCWWLYQLKEGLAEPASIFDGAEAIREARAVFQGAELTFRIRIVVGDMRTAVGFDDAQIGQQQRHRFGFHR